MLVAESKATTAPLHSSLARWICAVRGADQALKARRPAAFACIWYSASPSRAPARVWPRPMRWNLCNHDRQNQPQPCSSILQLVCSRPGRAGQCGKLLRIDGEQMPHSFFQVRGW